MINLANIELYKRKIFFKVVTATDITPEQKLEILILEGLRLEEVLALARDIES